jgi:hypothetical protein
VILLRLDLLLSVLLHGSAGVAESDGSAEWWLRIPCDEVVREAPVVTGRRWSHSAFSDDEDDDDEEDNEQQQVLIADAVVVVGRARIAAEATASAADVVRRNNLLAFLIRSPSSRMPHRPRTMVSPEDAKDKKIATGPGAAIMNTKV